MDYIGSGFFFIDLVATVSGLYYKEDVGYYFLKCFRIFHLFRLSQPLQLFLEYVLANLSKKRQGDIVGFANVIFFVIYLNHIMACCWVYLGQQNDCKTMFSDAKELDKCKDSWFYQGVEPNRFADQSITTQYIFAFYWIFEVITTVGYGDFTGWTWVEQLYSILVQFVGLVFFSLLMGHIT